MNEDFEKLKKIGVQKIHETTHISRIHTQAILHYSFEDMTKIQLNGFISILEREYSLNLSDLRDKGLEYFNDNFQEINPENSKVFVSPTKKRNFTPLFIFIAIVIFISFIMFTLDSSNNKEVEIVSVDNSVIEDAKSNMAVQTQELNTSKEIIIQEVIKESPQIEEISVPINSFVIKPKIKVWLGYIDLSTHKKYQTTFKDELSLDPKKDWLLALGHGHVNIEINGVLKEYKIKKNIRFSYKNGELKEINLEEFKKLNKGDRW